MASERLQKILAQAGIASRRAAERLITDGHVRVNGRIVRELGSKANPVRDRVEVDGKRLVAEKPVYYLLHKPRGVVTTLDDPEGRESIRQLITEVKERIFPVGRLDFQTSGVLLLTNDGAMAQALLHPTRRVPKVYSAKLQGPIDERGLELLRTGVVLDDGEKTAPAEVRQLRSDEKHVWLELTISEGKNRQIHRMAEAIGRRVLRLARISFAGLQIEGLRAGKLRPLTPNELNDLKQKYLNPQGHERPVRGKGRFLPNAPVFDGDMPQPEPDAPTRGARARPSTTASPRRPVQPRQRVATGRTRTDAAASPRRPVPAKQRAATGGTRTAKTAAPSRERRSTRTARRG